MALSHPLLDKLINIAKENNLNESKAFLAFECYSTLCEARKLWDVECEFRKELRIFFLTAKAEKNGPVEIFVPVTTSDMLSPEEIEALQNNLAPEKKQVTLIIKDTDSSTTYYRLSQGLVHPDSPTTMSKKKEQESLKRQFENEVIKNKKLMFAKALKNKSVDENR